MEALGHNAPVALGSGAGQKVLLISDQPLVLTGIQIALKQVADLAVSIACYVEAGVSACAGTRRYEMIVLDLDCRDCGRIRALRKLGALQPAATLLALTSELSMQEAEELTGVAGSAWVGKSASVQELSQALRASLAQSRTRAASAAR